MDGGAAKRSLKNERTKIGVERQQYARLANREGEDGGVTGRAEVSGGRRDVVTPVRERRDELDRNVLVEEKAKLRHSSSRQLEPLILA